MTTAKRDVPYVRELAKAEAAIRLDLREAGLPDVQHARALMILASKLATEALLEDPSARIIQAVGRNKPKALQAALKHIADKLGEEMASLVFLLLAYGMLDEGGGSLWQRLLNSLEAK